MIIRDITYTTNKIESVLSAEINLRGQKNKRLFFEIDSKWANYIGKDAGPFLAALLLPCMKNGENIEVDGEVSEKLLSAIRRVSHLCVGWNIGYKQINIEVAGKTVDTRNTKNRAVFFSGGVDSFYTYLHVNKKTPIKTWLFVHGFDIRLDDTVLYGNVSRILKVIAKKEKVSFIEIRTNLREFTDPLLDWDYAHGGALASVALALRHGLSTVFFSGGMEEGAIRPYGLHPDLDPLWSTDTLEIKHIGSKIRRIDKVRFISRFKIIQNSLRVCWRNTGGKYNCCKCEKCLRTMLSLYNANILEKCKTFPDPIDLVALSKVHILKNQIRYYQENVDALAVSGKNPILLNAIEKSILKNKQNSLDNTLILKIKHVGADIERKYFKGALFHTLSKAGFI